MKLHELLKGQDFGSKEIERIAEKVLNDEPFTDHITGIIVDAWVNNGGADGDFDKESAETDIDYAISQLKKCKETLKN